MSPSRRSPDMTHSHLRRISPAPMTDTDREAERDDLVRGRSAEQVTSA